jgi:hypothetical protein
LPSPAAAAAAAAFMQTKQPGVEADMSAKPIFIRSHGHLLLLALLLLLLLLSTDQAAWC